jgi:N-acetylneuraminic acid mutarotase
MIVWGGFNITSFHLNSGGRYDPSTDGWTATTNTNAPAARDAHTAVWSGSEMIVWGGTNGIFLNTGARYGPGVDSWTPTSMTNAPSARVEHTAVWSGSEMIVWGGEDTNGLLNTGGRYCAFSEATASPTPSATASPTPAVTSTPRIVPTPRGRPTPRARQ